MRILAITISLVLLTSSCEPVDIEPIPEPIQTLSVEFLNSGQPLAKPLSLAAFAPPRTIDFSGPGIMAVINLGTTAKPAGMEVIHDSFSIASNPSLKVTEFPEVSMELLSDGDTVLPVVQTPLHTDHPYWEFILQAGQQWQDPDAPGWNRVSLPFALKEKNQNCIHNGVMAFAYRNDGSITRVAWQISSETCQYLKVNLWGTLAASYQPGPVEAADQLVAAHRANRLSRLPVKPIESLIADYPTLPLQGLVPSDQENTSVHGFVMNGIHYRGGCQTRHGPYPFCDQLVLPSYSLAKSIFAGTYYLHLINDWPEFSGTRVSQLVPECQLPDGRWDDVTMSNLINMTTGNYSQAVHGLDESSIEMQTFFLAETHTVKIHFACEAWPRNSEPGTVAVYHTTDDYLLGTAMNAWVRQKVRPDADIFSDFLFPRFLEPLQLSPLMSWTQRTYDEAAQPFTAYGLAMLPDDLVRLALFLNSAFAEQELLNQEGYEQAMFRDVNRHVRWFEGNNNAYRNGYWGTELSEQLGCSKETWVPFMSGYGGISVALFPNGTIYYHFSDGNYFRFIEAAIASQSLINICII